MNWLARLKNENAPTAHATKATEPGFVGFVAPPPTGFPKNTPDTQARLLALAARYGYAPELVYALPASRLAECASLGDAELSALLSMLADDADREAGKVPAGYTTPTICDHCGPVWTFGKVGADGWAHVMGCPWCHVHGGVPRPSITSATCQHFKPDPINPAAGRGQCACGSFWPSEQHTCGHYQPQGDNHA